jgi:hypothetical protein
MRANIGESLQGLSLPVKAWVVLFREFVEHFNLLMVLHVLTDGQVSNERHALLAQVFSRTDAAEHQQLCGTDSTSGENNFVLGCHALGEGRDVFLLGDVLTFEIVVIQCKLLVNRSAESLDLLLHVKFVPLGERVVVFGTLIVVSVVVNIFGPIKMSITTSLLI